MDVFFNACQTGDVSAVTSLLSSIDPSDDDNWAIQLASNYGHVDVVKLLLTDPHVDPSVDGNWAIRAASYNGHIKVVYLLLTDLRVDPTVRNNYAIRWAKRNNHTEVVQLLTEYMYRLDGPIYNEGILT